MGGKYDGEYKNDCLYIDKKRTEKTETRNEENIMAKGNELVPGSTFVIQGKVNYSRIGSIIEGDELEARNKKSNHPRYSPYVTMTIEDAVVKAMSAPTPQGEELLKSYLQARIRPSKNDPTGPNKFTISSTTNFAPRVLKVNPADPSTQIPVSMAPDTQDGRAKELAQGLDVTLYLSTYSSSRGTGVGLDNILCNEEPRFFSMNQSAEMHGLNIVDDPNTPKNTEEVSAEPVQAVVPVVTETPSGGGIFDLAPDSNAGGISSPGIAPNFNN